MADDIVIELRRRLRAADRVINQMTADAERTQAQLNMAWDLCGTQRDEIERLSTALALAVGELSTHGEYTAWTPEMLMNQFLEEARRG